MAEDSLHSQMYPLAEEERKPLDLGCHAHSMYCPVVRRIRRRQGWFPTYAVCDLLGHHHDRCVQVAGDDSRHDRCVDDPHALHRFHPRLGVDDSLRVSAHTAGTGWVIRRAGSLANEHLEIAVADHVGTRTKFLPTIFVPNRLAYHRSRQSNAIDEIPYVLPGF